MQKAQNLLVSSLILGTLLAPSLTMAQVSAPATTEQVDTLKSTLITLLTQLIAQLQEQINTILAAQAKTDTNVAAVAAKVDTVVQNTTPALAASAQVSTPASQGSVSISVPGLPVADNYTVTTHPGDRRVNDDYNFSFVLKASESKIRFTTDSPDGFLIAGGVPGGQKPTTNDQTYNIVGNGQDHIAIPAYTVGIWHYTLSLANDPSISKTVTITVTQ